MIIPTKEIADYIENLQILHKQEMTASTIRVKFWQSISLILIILSLSIVFFLLQQEERKQFGTWIFVYFALSPLTIPLTSFLISYLEKITQKILTNED